jgi:hypothetical protein
VEHDAPAQESLLEGTPEYLLEEAAAGARKTRDGELDRLSAMGERLRKGPARRRFLGVEFAPLRLLERQRQGTAPVFGLVRADLGGRNHDAPRRSSLPSTEQNISAPFTAANKRASSAPRREPPRYREAHRRQAPTPVVIEFDR